MKKQESSNPRREFITTVLGGAAAFGLSSVASPLNAVAKTPTPTSDVNDALKWIEQIKGKKHKIVFDWTKHNNGAVLGWALAWMDTYKDMGIPDTDLSVVLVLRYATAPFAISDPLWAKYGFGKRIELKDPETKEFALKNLYAKCPTEDDNCIEILQKRGALVCVCNHSITGSAEGLAEQMKLDKEAVKKEFMDHMLPGIQLVPSGIWAVSTAQELGSSFSFGG
jgi:hypothetical protein